MHKLIPTRLSNFCRGRGTRPPSHSNQRTKNFTISNFNHISSYRPGKIRNSIGLILHNPHNTCNAPSTAHFDSNPHANSLSFSSNDGVDGKFCSQVLLGWAPPCAACRFPTSSPLERPALYSARGY